MKLIQQGDLAALEAWLDQHPEAIHQRDDGQRTLLHHATDWPGHFPNIRATITLLAQRGADLNAPFANGAHAETPLHWAASSGDLEALDTLLDLGANIEAPGSIINGGPPLVDAVVFTEWKAAHRLVERGAQTQMWQAAALGLLDCVKQHLEENQTPRDITNAFWNACRGGQIPTAQLLLENGAELNWLGHDQKTPLDAAIEARERDTVLWLQARGGLSAHAL